MNRYTDWINTNYGSVSQSLGKCREATDAMAKAFPELRPKRGFAKDAGGHEHTHWWLVDQTGVVVDPTWRQFFGRVDYTELPDDHPACLFRLRTCMECGTKSYTDSVFCGAACEEAFSGDL